MWTSAVRSRLGLILSLTALALAPDPGQAEGEMTERLFFQPIEKVITAGRTEQSIERAPATVTVISSAEIKASGALTIPELLRFVPGLDVMTISASHAEVNARGLNQLLSNKMLVLIDGRSVYFDFYGGIVWEGLPVLLDQIERIEVVRSPSSALYGANAFSGVINIITKTPRQMKGSQIKVQAGENGTLFSSLLAGAQRGDTDFRVALGSRRLNSLDSTDHNSENVVLGNIYLGHLFQNNLRLSVEGGMSYGSVEHMVRMEMNEFDATTTYAKLNLERDGFRFQAFWNRGDETADPFFSPGEDVSILYNTLDLEAQNMTEAGGKNTLIYGASYRLNTIESSIIDKDHSQNLLAVYFQDEYRPVPEISLLAGFRMDHHPLVGASLSPRGSLIYSPRSDHTLRFSVGQAFRNPSFTDSYFQLMTPYGLLIQGQPDLESEKITTWELGYTYFPSHIFRAEIDIFTYRFRDYIGPDAPHLENGVPVQSFHNLGRATASGFELSADVLPVPWMKLTSSYSFQDLDNHYTVRQLQRPPKHKAAFKTFFTLPRGASLAFLAGYTGRTVWEVPTPAGDYVRVDLDSHFRCDTRLAWSIGRRGPEIYAAALNLFNSRRLEYPLAERTRRRLTAGFNLGF